MESKQEEKLNNILEIVNFIKDKSAAKEDLSAVETGIMNYIKDNVATKAELDGAKDEILTKVDTFVSLHNKVDTELAALRSKYDRLEEKLVKIASHLQIEL